MSVHIKHCLLVGSHTLSLSLSLKLLHISLLLLFSILQPLSLTHTTMANLRNTTRTVNGGFLQTSLRFFSFRALLSSISIAFLLFLSFSFFFTPSTHSSDLTSLPVSSVSLFLLFIFFLIILSNSLSLFLFLPTIIVILLCFLCYWTSHLWNIIKMSLLSLYDNYLLFCIWMFGCGFRRCSLSL